MDPEQNHERRSRGERSEVAMKLHRATGSFTLIEYLVYIAILAISLGPTTEAIQRGYRNSLDLRRNADDIERTLKAGERWRDDVRAAVESPLVSDEGRVVVIRKANATVRYEFNDGKVWRENNQQRSVALDRVENSQMAIDRRVHLTALRWEVELATPQRVVRVSPLFSFEVVNGRTPR